MGKYDVKYMKRLSGGRKMGGEWEENKKNGRKMGDISDFSQRLGIALSGPLMKNDSPFRTTATASADAWHTKTGR